MGIFTLAIITECILKDLDLVIISELLQHVSTCFNKETFCPLVRFLDLSDPSTHL